MSRPTRENKPHEFFEGGDSPQPKSRQSKPAKQVAKPKKTSKKTASIAKRVPMQGQHATPESLQQLLRVEFHRDQIAVTESRIFSLVDSLRS